MVLQVMEVSGLGGGVSLLVLFFLYYPFFCFSAKTLKLYETVREEYTIYFVFLSRFPTPVCPYKKAYVWPARLMTYPITRCCWILNLFFCINVNTSSSPSMQNRG